MNMSERFKCLLMDSFIMTTYDLTGLLNRLPVTSPDDTMGHLLPGKRLPAFAKWRKETLIRREPQGFSVKQPLDDQVRQQKYH